MGLEMLAGVAGAGVTSAANFFAQRENRDWTERMSNSAYQRATKDMTKAGLNPALMYGHGAAASTPSVSPPQFDNPVDSVSSAVASKKMNAEVLEVGARTVAALSQAGDADAARELKKAALPQALRGGEKFNAELRALEAEAFEKSASAKSKELELPAKELKSRFYRGLLDMDDSWNAGRERLDATANKILRGLDALMNNSGKPVVRKPSSARELEFNMNKR
ncbi:MAG: DNA pilot protein [Microviridae sp.]|nr:MAG: DNA pilot protein [Microviridae sp.]